MYKKSRENFSLAGRSTNAPFSSVFVHQSQKLPNHDENQ